MSGLVLLTLVLLTASGCVRKPGTYRLLRQVVVPPEVTSPDLASRTFVAGIARGSGPCKLESPAIAIRPQGKTVRIKVKRDGLLQQPAGWLSEWSLQAEAGGCVAPGHGHMLANRIVQSLPLNSGAAFRLLYADTVRAGFVRLEPENRLEVRSPVFTNGALPEAPPLTIAKVEETPGGLNVDLRGSADTIGFEIAWYGLERKSTSPGHQFVPLSADRHVQGAVEHLARPPVDYLRFPAEARYFRLFYKGDDNGVRAIVIGGTTPEDADRRTRTVIADTAACETAAGMCLLLPRRIGINPFLVVKVNGRDVPVPLRSSVAAAMRAAGQRAPEEVLSSLKVTKPFVDRTVAVEFDHTSREILSLQLFGGETISWQTQDKQPYVKEVTSLLTEYPWARAARQNR